MRSVPRVDVTARARIRDAALDLFGRDGFQRASVRAVAEAAGVSPALVLHHFESKAGLRDSCDAYLLASIAEGKRTTVADGTAPSLEAYLGAVGGAQPLLRYLARSVQDGGEAAQRVVDGLIEDTRTHLEAAERRGVVAASTDPRARAALLVSWGLSTLLLGPVLAKNLDAPDGTAVVGRLARPALEIYTDGLFSDRSFLDAFLSDGTKKE